MSVTDCEACCVTGSVILTKPFRHGPLVPHPVLAVTLTGVVGSIDASWAALPDLLGLTISASNISGAVPHMLNLFDSDLEPALNSRGQQPSQASIMSCCCAGQLPADWATSWPKLVQLSLMDCNLHSTLPPEYGVVGGFQKCAVFAPALTRLCWSAMRELTPAVLSQSLAGGRAVGKSAQHLYTACTAQQAGPCL